MIILLFVAVWLIGAIGFGVLCTFVGGFVRPYDDVGMWIGLVLSAVIYVVATMMWLLI